MDTVHLLCGSCGQMMAVSVEHLGAQVHCPHCKAVVQAPPAARPTPGQEPTVLMSANGNDRDSIFAGPEPTDDIFGSGDEAKVEIPLPAPAPPPAPNLTLDATEHFVAPTIAAMAPPSPVHIPVLESPAAPSAPMLEIAPPSEEGSELPAPPPRRLEKKRNWPAILLIFLIPYAVIITGFLILQYVQSRSRVHPLKMLPDPAKDKGSPRYQVKHDLSLDPDMKVPLKKPIRVGILEMTPLKVQLTRDGDLVLHMNAKNLSKDLVFNPIDDKYLLFASDKLSMTAGRPYTYLDSSVQRIYGGFVDWRKNDVRCDGDIGPGEIETILLTTNGSKENRANIKRIVRSGEALLWRVQLRQGLVPVDGEMLSATTVVGIEFNANSIDKEG